MLEHTLMHCGTVDYDNGRIKINPVKITSVSDVDEATSTRFRLTVLPNSNDIVPVRNQLLELDLTNTSVSGKLMQLQQQVKVTLSPQLQQQPRQPHQQLRYHTDNLWLLMSKQ